MKTYLASSKCILRINPIILKTSFRVRFISRSIYFRCNEYLIPFHLTRPIKIHPPFVFNKHPFHSTFTLPFIYLRSLYFLCLTVFIHHTSHPIHLLVTIHHLTLFSPHHLAKEGYIPSQINREKTSRNAIHPRSSSPHSL